ncbi:MAG: hypothetical protein KA184_06810 [Candidatus Hydrogenedentes bacterium]|nr:hypothetical protein [Candidatus Hydrogenedentota bacterium]
MHRALFLGILFSAVVTFAAPGTAAAPLRACLVDDPAAGAPRELIEGLRTALEATEYTVTPLDFRGLCDPASFQEPPPDLLVLPDAASLPVLSVEPITAFLHGGGDILALNTPLWRRPLLEDGETWVDRETFARQHAAELLEHTLFDFETATLDAWKRTSNDLATVTTHEKATVENCTFKQALHVSVEKLTSWDTFVSPPLEAPFPEGHTLTVFWARGGPDTAELAIEWTEKDLSRWIATIPLTREWRQYVLEPKDFRFWESVPARQGTVFDPANAASLSVGLAHSHTRLRGERHEYWLGNFGTAARTPNHEKLLTAMNPPALETLCPGYKFFAPAGAAALYVRKDQAFLKTGLLPQPGTLWCSHPRPRAGGFDKGRDWRWTPLLEARTEEGAWRGNPATLLVHADGPYKGGVWASFSISDSGWYVNREVQARMTDLLRRMHGGVFLIDGGADFYTYFERQPVTLGLRVFNASGVERTGLAGHIRMLDRYTGTTVAECVFPLDLPPGETLRIAGTQNIEAWPEHGCAVYVDVAEGDRVLDHARHEAHVWRPDPEPAFISVKDGELLLQGSRWRAHGVNYMPSSGIGTEDGGYFEQWIGARSYDPEVIDRDLRHIVELGLNSVSVFIYHDSLQAQNLLDLLRRCDAFGLKVNLSLRPGTPLEFEWDKIRELLEYYRIPEHDCVFALDLAWEPMFGNHEERKRWDEPWRAWVIERYGSIENAEKDWQFQGPRDEQGLLTNPLGNQTVEDGGWRVMVAAYRRFLDTLLYEYYSRARTLVRSVDPVHLVSFRMTEAGNPTFLWGERIPYDFPYLAAAVDLLEPEAYGRIGDWEKVKPGWFEFEYARWAAPHLPMLWAEAGVHAWSESVMDNTPDLLQFQADYYTHLYRMFTESGADGVFFWWYPGGYRANERSDYGIINPDGSDRPVTRVIRDHAASFINGPPPRTVTHWIEIDRDAHPAGVAGIYESVRDEFWRLIEAGEGPGLKTKGTGANSADCPLIAVGNTPYTGSGPLKYLDGFFDRVEIQDETGAWREIARGAEVAVQTDKPVLARVTLINLGEAQWLSSNEHAGPGAVVMTVEGPETKTLPLPVSVPKFGTVEIADIEICAAAPETRTEFTLGLKAQERATFGPRFPFVAVPAAASP